MRAVRDCLAETGFVVTPFLPGDSLLFATGALCATGTLSTPAALALLALARSAANAVNYTVGRIIGLASRGDGSVRISPPPAQPRASDACTRILRALRRAKAVILGVRPDRPHVRAVCRWSGADALTRVRFYNVIGAVACGLCVGAGLFVRERSPVKENFPCDLGIVFVSLLP